MNSKNIITIVYSKFNVSIGIVLKSLKKISLQKSIMKNMIENRGNNMWKKWSMHFGIIVYKREVRRVK